MSEIAGVRIFPQTSNCIFIKSYNLSHKKKPQNTFLTIGIDHLSAICDVIEGVGLVKMSC